MKRYALVAAMLFLCACSHQPDLVEVPTALPCPPPPAVARPHLPAADLDAGTPPDQVMKALVASLQTLTGDATELEKLLDAYRPAPGR